MKHKHKSISDIINYGFYAINSVGYGAEKRGKLAPRLTESDEEEGKYGKE